MQYPIESQSVASSSALEVCRGFHPVVHAGCHPGDDWAPEVEVS